MENKYDSNISVFLFLCVCFVLWIYFRFWTATLDWRNKPVVHLTAKIYRNVKWHCFYDRIQQNYIDKQMVTFCKTVWMQHCLGIHCYWHFDYYWQCHSSASHCLQKLRYGFCVNEMCVKWEWSKKKRRVENKFNNKRFQLNAIYSSDSVAFVAVLMQFAAVMSNHFDF